MPFIGTSSRFNSADGRTVTLDEPLVFISTERGATTTVPEGFVSDGASTPQVVWDLIPPFGNYWRGAVLHDWFYRETYLPREFCDGVFLEAMDSLGVSHIERDTIYEAVRLFGGEAFACDRAALDARLEAERDKAHGSPDAQKPFNPAM